MNDYELETQGKCLACLYDQDVPDSEHTCRQRHKNVTLKDITEILEYINEDIKKVLN